MKIRFTIRRFSTDRIIWAEVLPILILAFTGSSVRAEDYTQMTPMPLIDSRPDNSIFANEDRHDRLAQLLDYVHHEGPALVPGLPDAMRGPANFVMHQVKSAEDEIGFGDGDTDHQSEISAFLAPMFSLMRPAEDGVDEALWLAPGYHHMHGMLPFNDAVTFGFAYRNIGLFDDRVRFRVHPYYAQSWHCADSYWGAEAALGIGPSAERSWGTLVLRYNNGSSNLMDQQRGYDMHADFSFDEHVSLTAGMQQEQEGDLGNYVLLKWKLSGF